MCTATTLNSLVIPNPAARLGRYNYRMNGDSASLSTELAVLDGKALAGARLGALRLWACDADPAAACHRASSRQGGYRCPGRR